MILLNSWNDITVDQFIQLKSVEESDFHSLLSFKMDQLFILTNTSIEDDIWNDVDTDKLQELFEEMDWLKVQPSLNFSRSVLSYHFKELNTITLGEFIDLESLFNINYLLKLPEICAILYRQNRLNDWGHIVIEPRTYSEFERADQFMDVKITEVYGILQAYLTFKKKFIDGFENLFEEPMTEQEQEEAPEPLTAEDFEAVRKEKAVIKWNWERIIHYFAQSHSLTFDQVTELKLIFVFNQLSMMKDLKLD